jgi:hypothetical protein
MIAKYINLFFNTKKVVVFECQEKFKTFFQFIQSVNKVWIYGGRSEFNSCKIIPPYCNNLFVFQHAYIHNFWLDSQHI